MKTYQKFIVSAFVLSATVALVACGKSTTKAEKNESSKADNVTTITVATDADTKPFTYSENNQATGYDVEVARAVFKELPEY
ncbi:MAG: transporter substrate-binding domain-containing protein, partial [Lactococcus raffinolactis]